MKTVINQLGRRKGSSDSQHHSRRQIGCNRSDRESFLEGKPAQDTAYPICCHSTDHGNQSTLTPFGCLVGQDCIDISVTQTSLIQGKILSKVLRIKDIVMCVLELRPFPIIADILIVLLAERLSFYTVPFCQSAYTDGSRFNLLLLKKTRTLH